jgi:hypothetical protein
VVRTIKTLLHTLSGMLRATVPPLGALVVWFWASDLPTAYAQRLAAGIAGSRLMMVNPLGHVSHA